MRQNKNPHSPPGKATSWAPGFAGPTPRPPPPDRHEVGMVSSGTPESPGPSSGSLLGSSTHQELEHSVGKEGARGGCSSEGRRDLPPPARWAAPAADFRLTPRSASPALLHPEAVPSPPSGAPGDHLLNCQSGESARGTVGASPKAQARLEALNIQILEPSAQVPLL